MQNFFRRPRGVAQIVRQVVEEFLNSHRRFRSAQLAQFGRRKAEIAHLSPSPITARSSTRTIPTISFGYVLAYNLAKMPPKECAAKTYGPGTCASEARHEDRRRDHVLCATSERPCSGQNDPHQENAPGRSYAQTRVNLATSEKTALAPGSSWALQMSASFL